MRRPVRFALVALAAVVIAAALWWVVGSMPPPDPAKAISRRDAFLGLLTLGVLCVAVLGLDIRDYF